MSELEVLTARYLETRRQLGYQLARERVHLPVLARFVVSRGSDYLSVALMLEWAADTPSGSAAQTARRLGWARKLARYLHAHDSRTEVPPQNLTRRCGPRRAAPYLYAAGEVAALIDACGRRLGPGRARTYTTLIRLLAVTGMRIGEAMGLDRADLDVERHHLTIRSGKFGKARRLPLAPSTCDALVAYRHERERCVRAPRSEALLLSDAGTRLIYSNAHLVFHRLVDEAGLGGRRPRPSPHDLRHSFAVATLRRWYAEDREIESRLPVLSTWLGHVNPSSTYWYLTATPELLELARARAERRTGRGA